PPATLSGNPANGIFTGGGISGNMFDPAVAGLGTHTVNYNYTDPNGCSGSYSESTIVSGNAYLNLGADTIVCDDAPVFTINAGTFSSYTWHDNSSAATYSVDAVALGVGFYTMYVNVTDANGCNGTDTIVVEVSDCTGLTEFSGMQISIAPNPSTGIFQISLSGLSSDNIRLTLTNVAGQTVMMKNVSLTSGLYKDQLDLTMLPGGIYFLQVSDGTQSGVYKIVLE
ncbi:MAG TPA: T9SS type A sorting domain-containing protein, partial [Bacteroidia bacterium]|nr:T9SS type A sorting domain-containing protein [Bacteroidia bacterium]